MTRCDYHERKHVCHEDEIPFQDETSGCDLSDLGWPVGHVVDMHLNWFGCGDIRTLDGTVVDHQFWQVCSKIRITDTYNIYGDCLETCEVGLSSDICTCPPIGKRMAIIVTYLLHPYTVDAMTPDEWERLYGS